MPRGPRKFHFSFDRTGLTRFGGLCLFQHFCKSLRLRHFLQLAVRWPRYPHRNYHPADLFLAHVFSIAAGIGRIENTQSLLHNGLVPPILGLPEFPHRDTLRTFLWRFNQQTLRSLQTAHDKLRADLFGRMNLLYSATLDADTTTLMTFGHQEGVAYGWTPKRYHRNPTYAPILASEGRTGLSLGFQLRAGNVRDMMATWHFIQQILDKMPPSIARSRLRLRLDGAFYSQKLIPRLDEEGIGYVIVARMTKRLRKYVVSASYHQFAKGWEAAEFPYTPFHWKKSYRFIAVRRPKGWEPEELQKRFFTFRRHIYHRTLITSLPLTPEAVYRFYCDRAFQELLIREFKDSYGMAQIPTRSYWANAAYMEMILWTFDLVRAFQFLCLPEEFCHWNISTLRRELWSLPAEWVKHGDRNILGLPARFPNQPLFSKIEQATKAVKPLF